MGISKSPAEICANDQLEPVLGPQVAGLVTLATPFLAIKPRGVDLIVFLLFHGILFTLAMHVRFKYGVSLTLRSLAYARTFAVWKAVLLYLWNCMALACRNLCSRRNLLGPYGRSDRLDLAASGQNTRWVHEFDLYRE